MTIDVEDYFHVHAFAQVVSREDWATMESRVVRNTERLLDLFAQKADIVLCSLTLLRGHVRLLRKTPIGPPWAGSAQPVVNFSSRMNTGIGAVRLNQSFILFVKTPSIYPI